MLNKKELAMPLDPNYPWCKGCILSSHNAHCGKGSTGECVKGDEFQAFMTCEAKTCEIGKDLSLVMLESDGVEMPMALCPEHLKGMQKAIGMEDKDITYHMAQIHESQRMERFWSLGKAQYLTIPRSIIQEMPIHWQDNFARLLNELDRTFDWRPKEGRYIVYIGLPQCGSEIPDPLMEYRHGNPHAKALHRGIVEKPSLHVGDENRIQKLKDMIESLGVKEAFDTFHLLPGTDIGFAGCEGHSAEHQGEGILFVSFLPIESFQQ